MAFVAAMRVMSLQISKRVVCDVHPGFLAMISFVTLVLWRKWYQHLTRRIGPIGMGNIPVDVSESLDHGDLKWNICAVAVVYLINHFDGVAPSDKLVNRIKGMALCDYVHADVIKPNTRDIIENLFRRCPLKTFGNHGLSYI